VTPQSASPIDYLRPYAERLPLDLIGERCRLREAAIQQPVWERIRHLMESLPRFRSSHVLADQDCIEIGRASELSSDQQTRMKELLDALKPWKKGPFRLFDTLIDAEWQSHWKWQRIEPHLDSLRGQKVADIGCHNGYYMYRMATHQPHLVVGFEPFAKHKLTFDFFNSYAGLENTHLEMLGVEDIDLFPRFFDTIFCLGILYHFPDPVGILLKIKEALAPKGRVIIDCQGIPGEESVALIPPGRYAGAKGIWYLPTLACLQTWLLRSNFRKVNVIYHEELSTEEQRRTPWAPIRSLAEYIDPANPHLTTEGLPRPHRFYVIASP